MPPWGKETSEAPEEIKVAYDGWIKEESGNYCAGDGKDLTLLVQRIWRRLGMPNLPKALCSLER